MAGKLSRKALAARLLASAVVAAAAGCTSAPPVGAGSPTGPVCTPGSLRARLAATDTGLGESASTIELINDSATACRLLGVPTVDLLDTHGGLIRAAVPRPGGTPRTVAVSRAAVASFVMTYRTFDPVTGRACTPVTALGIGLPGGAGRITLAAALAPCGPVAVAEFRTGAGQEN